MKVWLDGRMVDDDQATVSVFNHGLTVGDGVFETLKVVDGQAFALTRHLARLGRSATGLGLPVPSMDRVRHAVIETIAANPIEGQGRLRITLTGGDAPQTSERGDAEPTLLVTLTEQKPWADDDALVVVPWRRNENSPIAGLKTTSYAENVVALAAAKKLGGGEALLADSRGMLSEGTGSNIFVVLKGKVLTPSLASGCLDGITRRLILEWTDAEEDDLPLSVLDDAEEVFITSSTRDVMPIRAIDGLALPNCPGTQTRRVSEVFAERAAADIDP